MLINIYSIISDSLPNEVTDHLTQRTNPTNESNKGMMIVNGTERTDSQKIIVLPIPSVQGAIPMMCQQHVDTMSRQQQLNGKQRNSHFNRIYCNNGGHHRQTL